MCIIRRAHDTGATTTGTVHIVNPASAPACTMCVNNRFLFCLFEFASFQLNIHFIILYIGSDMKLWKNVSQINSCFDQFRKRFPEEMFTINDKNTAYFFTAKSFNRRFKYLE